MSASPRWKHRPPNSSWGEFGADDRLGRLHLITPEKVRQGVSEVKEGLTFCLSLPLDYPGGQTLNPRRLPPKLFATIRNGASAGQQGYCWPYAAEDPECTDVVCDEVMLMNTQYSTQWDSLAHMGGRFDADGDGVAEALFYNGFKAGVDIHSAPKDENPIADWARYPNPHADVLNVANMATHGLQGCAVMIDLAAHTNGKRAAVGYEQMMRIMAADKVSVEEGDMVCLRTGFDSALLAMNKQPDVRHLEQLCVGLDGRDERLLNWITDVRLSCLISDNPAVELMPAPSLLSPDGSHKPLQARLPLHEHCLFKNGIHLGELWLLSPLADWLRAKQRNRFLLTAPPLRLTGAVGSPVTPIATV